MEDIKKRLIKVGKAHDVLDPKANEEKLYSQIETVLIEKPDVTFLKIRDALFGMGKILEENKEDNYYLSTFYVGSTAAVLIAAYTEGKVEAAAWAKEGLIKRHIAKKALNRFVEIIEGK